MTNNLSAGTGDQTETQPNEVQMATSASSPAASPPKKRHPREGVPRPPRSKAAQTTPFSVRSRLAESFGLPLLSHHELTRLLVWHYGSLFLRREAAEKALMQSRELLETCVAQGWLRAHTSENRMTSYSAADIAACLLRIEVEGRPDPNASGSGQSDTIPPTTTPPGAAAAATPALITGNSPA